MEKSHDALKTEVGRLESRVSSTSEHVKTLDSHVEQQAVKLKEANEAIYDLKNVQFVALNTRLNNDFSSKHDLEKFKTEVDQKVVVPPSLSTYPCSYTTEQICHRELLTLLLEFFEF